VKYVCCTDNDCNTNRKDNKLLKEVVETNKANIYACGDKISARKAENGEFGKACENEIKIVDGFETDQEKLRLI